MGSSSVPVVGSAPAHLMGSGLGSPADRGDYDIQTADRETFEALGLAQLRLGDLVALPDADHSYGRGYRKGALTIAVVAHCDSFSAGHGPGRHLAPDQRHRRDPPPHRPRGEYRQLPQATRIALDGGRPPAQRPFPAREGAGG